MHTSQEPSVRAWTETITLPTYPALDPDPNPMFFDSRDIQRSKGNIYPLPFTDRLSSKKIDREYKAVFLENEYIQMTMLPELGGRIFAGLDKTNGYDFFYRHKVIKPALIGLLGPWISGGVEFNWPQHHRPSTFMPVDYSIEESPDGSKTVWMGEHEPLNRTKGMVGICLHPGKAFVETRARLYNRTPFPQTFLWWENAGVHIDEQYQVIFPPDVHYAQFHTKEYVIRYPLAKGLYNSGLDYGEGTDISYWANTPIASSFFAAESKYSFFGGYDHTRKAGVVHVANRHISPGKKFFTWANGPFGHQWQRNLMDDTGEYLELMAGAYTDNQPDFSWIMPHETRTFSQFWFPVQEIGPMKNANTRAAVNLAVDGGKAHIGLYVTESFPQACVVLSGPSGALLEETADLAPGKAYLREGNLPEGLAESELLLRVLSEDGMEIIRYAPEAAGEDELPEPYQPPARPEEMGSVEELYLAGLHLEQYRHPVFAPEPYWQEALRRDPQDSRSSLEMGKLALRRGQFAKAEEYFRSAVKRLTSRNPNPYDVEAYYQLGLTLKYQGRLDEAYEALYKSTWNAGWQSAAFYAIAQTDCLRGDWPGAFDHLERALAVNTQHLQARDLKAVVLRHMDRPAEAGGLVENTLSLDPLDAWARFECILAAQAMGRPGLCDETQADFSRITRDDVLMALDVAYDYSSAGLWDEAVSLLSRYTSSGELYPMVAYTLGWLLGQLGSQAAARHWYSRAALASPDYCFPSRLEEMLVLQAALAANPEDARAHYYLGNLLYDKKQHAEAVAHWKESTRLQPSLAIPWRNLGLAAFNLDRDPQAAEAYFVKALAANPGDPRILLEYDQLRRRMACPPEERLTLLESRQDLVAQRDDLTMEWAALCIRLGQPQKALDTITGRSFHPWEGGEGTVAGQYSLACWLLGRQQLDSADADAALAYFQKGLDFPNSLGEVPSDAEMVTLLYGAGEASEHSGQSQAAREYYERLLHMGSWGMTGYYQALALRKLGRAPEADEKLREMRSAAEQALQHEAEPNFFYQALPSPVFEDDLQRLNEISNRFLVGLANLGLGSHAQARADFARVLTLDPAHTLAWEEYRRLS